MILQPLVIRIPGEIRGKGRPRFSTRGGFARVYTDDRTLTAENLVKLCAVEQVGQPMLFGPLALSVDVVVKVPASWSKRKAADALGGQLRPTGKPDADNTLKLLSDALNGIVWKDDAQLVDVRLTKRYGAEPGAVLTVATL